MRSLTACSVLAAGSVPAISSVVRRMWWLSSIPLSDLPAPCARGVHRMLTDNGGKTAAVLRTFVASCERVKIDPWAWYRDVLSRIATHPINQLDDLLPHRWAPAGK